jgi:hypothetical protein
MRYNQTRTDRPDGYTEVTGYCTMNGSFFSVTVPTSGLDAWLKGELIQHAMPLVAREDREFLISGVSPSGWQQMVADFDDEYAWDGDYDEVDSMEE